MNPPLASVIVRAKNKERTIARTLASLRGQTVPPEIIVVDSGSTDRTVEIARESADHVIEIPPETFTYGRALNIGAQAASAPIHFALSAHCFAPTRDWIERSLAHYERPDVAGTAGYAGSVPWSDESPVVYQDRETFRAHPFWGFSNHASSWRASVWKDFPFDETVESSEDKEWAWRVLEAAWVIVLDPALAVRSGHRFDAGLLAYYRQAQRDARALATFYDLPPYRLRDAVREWWNVSQPSRRAGLWNRLSPGHVLGIAAKYSGFGAARRRRALR